MAKILIFVLKYSINYVEIIKYKGGIKMAEINQESGVFGGISFENNMNQSGVVENAGTLAIDKIIVNKTKDDNNGSATGKVDIGGDVNGNGFNFVNTYVQEAGTGTDPTNPGTDPDDDYTKYGSLNVSKTIDAQAGTVDSDAEFTFTAKFEFPKGTDAETLEAKAGDATLTLDENNQHTFTLKHGQNMKYTGLPVGTKITVTETGVANYKGSVSVVLNGGTATTDTAAKYHADFEAVKDGKLGQQKNTVD